MNENDQELMKDATKAEIALPQADNMIIHDEQAVIDALVFAEEIGRLEELRQQFATLTRFQWNGPAWLHVYADFAPFSFYWIWTSTPSSTCSRDAVLMNGGIIYHGRLRDQSKPETFSVSLDHSGRLWQIHT